MEYIREEFDSVLFDSRIEARSLAKQVAAVELDISTIDAAAYTDEDSTRSSLIAASLVGAIGLAALILLKRGKSDPLKYAIALEDYRLRRVAATETFNAYSRGHYEIDVPEGWARRWDATLDIRICRICRQMHGETVPVDESFSGGLVPGDVHPNCRCFPTYVPLSLMMAA